MTPELTVAMAFGLLLVLIAAEVPVAFALIGSAMAGLVVMMGFEGASNVLVHTPFNAIASFSLVVVPMFVLMGMFAQRGSIAVDSFAFAARITRNVPGGLAVASIVACALFGAISGSSLATVASVGRIAMTEMRRHGYNKVFAAGVVGAAGTLGVLIPPSVVLVIYGIVAGVSIGQLLIAGIIPGVLSATVYILNVWLRVRRGEGRRSSRRSPVFDTATQTDAADAAPPVHGHAAGSAAIEPAADEPAPAGTTADAKAPIRYRGVIQIAVVFTIVIGGIYSGTFTATEAAALGAAAAGLLVLLDGIRDGRVVWSRASLAVRDAIEVTAMTLLLIAGASMFTYLVVIAGIPTAFSAWVTGLAAPGWVVLALFLLIFIPLGMVLDGVSILLIAVPIMFPTVIELGYSGVWFGIMTVKMIEIALVTPPVGLNAFMVAGVAEDLSLEDAFRGILKFLPADIFTVVILFAFPVLTTWLPDLTG